MISLSKVLNVLDVSKYQTAIDFSKIKDKYDGIIIRIGYRGYGAKGTLVKDPKADAYINGAIDAGMPYGVYFLSQAKTRTEGESEAKYVLKLLKEYKAQPLYPVYIDSEWSNINHNGRADYLTASQRTEACLGFLETIQNAGYYAGIYASTSWFYSHLEDDKLKSFTHWVAHYAAKCTYDGRIDIWQYSSSIPVDGISPAGKGVDHNYCYADFPAIIKANGLNGYEKGESTPETPVDLGENKPFAKKPVYITCGPASVGDLHSVAALYDKLMIPYHIEDGWIYSDVKVSSGDQVRVVELVNSLGGFEAKEYVPVTVLEAAGSPEEEDIPEIEIIDDPEDKIESTVGILAAIIKLLVKAIRNLKAVK